MVMQIVWLCVLIDAMYQISLCSHNLYHQVDINLICFAHLMQGTFMNAFLEHLEYWIFQNFDGDQPQPCWILPKSFKNFCRSCYNIGCGPRQYLKNVLCHCQLSIRHCSSCFSFKYALIVCKCFSFIQIWKF